MNRAGAVILALIARLSLLARSRRIDLAGNQVETPLLVPAISSMAVDPIPTTMFGQKRRELVAASMVHTATFLPRIEEAALVSAYDVFHELLADAKAFTVDFTASMYAVPAVLFIDSGWYEKMAGTMSGLWHARIGRPAPFELTDYEHLLRALDPELQAVAVSWDTRGTYLEQIAAAQRLLGDKARLNSDILLKPEGGRDFHDFRDLSTNTAARLHAFDVVGVTEKELGDRLLGRLVSLAQLRKRLDEAAVMAPIHVFGGLDPLMTPLYFVAGGEVFDGLTWLRYAFRGGQSVARDSALVLDRVKEKRVLLAATDVQHDNLDALRDLSRDLKVFFHNGGDWKKLRHGDILRQWYEAMESVLEAESGR